MRDDGLKVQGWSVLKLGLEEVASLLIRGHAMVGEACKHVHVDEKTRKPGPRLGLGDPGRINWFCCSMWLVGLDLGTEARAG